MGIKPAQALQQAGQMGQAAGRSVSAREFEQGLALQTTLGIGGAQSGAAIRQMRYAGELSGFGTSEGNMEQIADLIGSAVALNLEGSEIGEYLQSQTGFLGQMVNQGIGIDIQKLRELEASIGEGLNAKWRGAPMARQFLQGAAAVGREGATSAAKFRLMRAFGFSGEGGLEEFYKIRGGMQSPDLAQEYGMADPVTALSAYIESFRIPGVGPATQAGILQQAFADIGMSGVGFEESMAMSQGLQRVAPGDYEIDSDAAARLVSAVAPSTQAEAGIEAERAAIGGGVATAMQDLERVTNNMAIVFKDTLGPSMESFAEVMEGLTRKIGEVVSDDYSLMDPFGLRDP